MKGGAELVTPGHLLSKSKVERDRIVINLTMGVPYTFKNHHSYLFYQF